MRNKPIKPHDYDKVVAERKRMKAEALSRAMVDPICAGYAELLATCPMAQFIDNLSDYDDNEQEEDDIRPY